MVLINKHPKLSCHMASMSIHDRRLIKPVMRLIKPFLKWDLCFVIQKPFTGNIISTNLSYLTSVLPGDILPFSEFYIFKKAGSM